MRRIVMMILRNIIWIPYYVIQMFLYAREKDHTLERKKYAFLQEIVRHANRGGNVELICKGAENIPKEEGYIFYPNHQGMYDMLAIIETTPSPVAVVMKKEAADIPFLKQVRLITKSLAMDREDVRQSMKIILQVAEEVAAGRNYVIFPEGTRSRNGNVMGEFKGGSFKAATKAKCPIIPVMLYNSFVPFDSHSLKQIQVYIHYLQPILYEEYKGMKTTEIAEMVKERIQMEMESLEKEIEQA